MKDSGIPWIGEIPEEWETHRLKSVFASRISGEWGDDAQNDYNDRVCLRIADFDYKRLRFKHCESYTIRNYSKAEENLPYLKNGDILIEKSGGGEKNPVGRAIVYDLEFDKAMYANFMTRLRVKAQINPWFIEYMLSTLYAYGALNVYIKQTTGIQNLDITTMLEEEKIFLPSLAEQQRIAEFLDRKCAEVDDMIALQEQIIEELKAYKQSVITEAVTKGLNPAAPMRDSGIEWIGSIPEHWEVKRIKYIGTAENGLIYTPADVCDVSDGILVLRSSNIQNGKLAFNDNVYVRSVPESLKVKVGDIIICSRNGSASLVGKSALVETDIDASFGAFMMRFRSNHSYKYIYFLLTATISHYKQLFTTTTINQLTIGLLNNIAMPFVENKEEQQAIADYLDKMCGEIDKLIAIKQSKIDSLKEYKKSIIYEYVTGKREVE